MYTRKFWKDALERAVVTFLQFAIVLVPANLATLEINWSQVFTYCAAGFALALGKAMIAGLSNSSASLVDNEPEVLGKHHPDRVDP